MDAARTVHPTDGIRLRRRRAGRGGRGTGARASGPPNAARGSSCSRRTAAPGVKILMSGGTRCNLTNARGLRRLEVVSGPIDPAFDPSQCRGIRAIQDAFGPGGAFLGPALRRLDVDQTVRLFEAEGVATKVEGNGKIFPVVGPGGRRARCTGAPAGPERGHLPLPEPRAVDRARSSRATESTAGFVVGCRARPSRPGA